MIRTDALDEIRPGQVSSFGNQPICSRFAGWVRDNLGVPQDEDGLRVGEVSDSYWILTEGSLGRLETHLMKS